VKRPRLVATSPLFVVSDLARSLDFYSGKLGFERLGSWGEPPCFAIVRRDGFELMLKLEECPGQVRPNGPHGIWDAYFWIADVRFEVDALRRVAVEPARPPQQTSYATIESEVLDPDGYRICLAQDTSGSR
jgi:catechol 2,3-dioxygenase-like lactoylglutathione lyase family enzyme